MRDNIAPAAWLGDYAVKILSFGQFMPIQHCKRKRRSPIAVVAAHREANPAHCTAKPRCKTLKPVAREGIEPVFTEILPH